MVFVADASRPEPVLADPGVYKGTTVLREEEAEGWTFMNTPVNRSSAKAVIGMDSPFDGYASGFKDNIVVAMAACRSPL